MTLKNPRVQFWNNGALANPSMSQSKKRGTKNLDHISKKMNDYDPQLDNCNSNAPEVKRMWGPPIEESF